MPMRSEENPSAASRSTRAARSESAEESHGSFASIGARKEFGYQVFPLARGAR